MRFGIRKTRANRDERLLRVIVFKCFGQPFNHFVHQTIDSNILDNMVNINCAKDFGIHLILSFSMLTVRSPNILMWFRKNTDTTRLQKRQSVAFPSRPNGKELGIPANRLPAQIPPKHKKAAEDPGNGFISAFAISGGGGDERENNHQSAPFTQRISRPFPLAAAIVLIGGHVVYVFKGQRKSVTHRSAAKLRMSRYRGSYESHGLPTASCNQDSRDDAGNE